MSKIKIKRALISVYDKTGIVEFARALVDEFDIEIISTGGTATLLKENKIPVTLVEEVTGFPEMMDGRVKTLHPKIHAGILADRDNPEHMKQLEELGIKPIDMVVVNLYPFEKTVADPTCTFEQAIEMIDIGGPSMLRAAAKNHKHVLCSCYPHQYDSILTIIRSQSPEKLLSCRYANAILTFKATWRYDRQINAYLESILYQDLDQNQVDLTFDLPRLDKSLNLRYGENPHQKATGKNIPSESQSVPEEEPIIFGTSCENEMSFNNYMDAEAAFSLCKELNWGWRGIHTPCGQPSSGTLSQYSCSFIKHTNPCGCALADDPIQAYEHAYHGDVNAAMGCILAINFTLTKEFASTMMSTYDRWGKNAGAGGFFVEVLIAPDVEVGAEEVIRMTKPWGSRLRLLTTGEMSGPADTSKIDIKKVSGGFLFQDRDTIGLNEDQWKVVSKRQPTDQEMQDLRLAWLICKHTKSNAITICKDNMLIGNGAGQMSRVMSCRIATWLAKENGHEVKLIGSVAASDAFFPFPDGPNILIEAGVTAIIQPGGSKRDEDTIVACNERDVAMIFTSTRHFKH